MQYRVAICDDVRFYVEEIKEYIESFCKNEKKEIEITTYLDSTDFIYQAKQREYDIIFLDVDMPLINGIEIAKLVREFDTDVVIVFITSHEGFSLQATQVEAMGYIIKPIDQEKFFRILKKAVILVQGIQAEQQLEKQYIEITADYERVVLDIRKIIYLQKVKNLIQVHLGDGRKYFFYDTIKNLMTVLPRNQFCKVSGSMIVNMAFVKDMKAYYIQLKIGDGLKEDSISRVCYKQLKREFLMFQKNKK